MGNKLSDFLKDIARKFSEFSFDEPEMISFNNRSISVMKVFDEVQNSLGLTPSAAATEYDEAGNPLNAAPSPPDSYVLDVRADDKGIFAIYTKGDGKMYKVPVTIGADDSITVGTSEEGAMEFLPMSRGITVQREKSGKLRWFAMPACTAVLNRSGEIDSTRMFDNFVEFINRTGKYPILDFYHQREKIVLGRADWVARDGVSYCASGLFDDTEIGRCAAKALEEDPGYWGLSISYLPTSNPEMIRSTDNVEIPVYKSGINRFISLLPEHDAASILTSITSEVSRMKPEVKSALAKLLGKDHETLLAEFEAKIDNVERAAQDGMISREATPQTTTVETHTVETSSPAPVPAQPVIPDAIIPENRALQLDPESIKTIVTEMLASPDFKMAVEQVVKSINTPTAPVDPAKTNALNENSINPTVTSIPDTTLSDLNENMRKISEQMSKFAEKVSELENGNEEKIRETLDNLPTRLMRNGYRPRAAIIPDTLVERKANLAAKAQKTLEELKK